jgi:hypothetical protein
VLLEEVTFGSHHPFMSRFPNWQILSRNSTNDVLSSLHPSHCALICTDPTNITYYSFLSSTTIQTFAKTYKIIRMPQSNHEEVYIPYISDEYPSSFPPVDNDEGQAWVQWQLTLTPDQKTTYNQHLDEAIIRYNSLAPSERQSRPQLPEQFSTKRISREFNFSWGSEKREERVVSYFEVYKLNAEQMSRFKSDMEKSVTRWVSVGTDTEGEVQAAKADDGEKDRMEEEEDDEIYIPTTAMRLFEGSQIP